MAPTVHVEVRQVLPVQAGSRAGAAGDSGDHRVLPGGVEVQMWQQVVHAVATTTTICTVFPKSTSTS